MESKRLLVWFLAILFVMASSVALAAEEQWVVIKDKNGVCKVISSKGTTPETVAGPFPSKEKAEEAKAKACPKADQSLTDKLKDKAKQEIDKAKSAAEKVKEAAGAELEKVKSAADKVKEKVKEQMPSDKK